MGAHCQLLLNNCLRVFRNMLGSPPRDVGLNLPTVHLAPSEVEECDQNFLSLIDNCDLICTVIQYRWRHNGMTRGTNFDNQLSETFQKRKALHNYLDGVFIANLVLVFFLFSTSHHAYFNTSSVIESL